MTVTLALDLGNHLGWALEMDRGTVISGTEDFTPGRHEGGGMCYLRFRKFLQSVETGAEPTVVYYEEVRRHLGVDAAHKYGGYLAILTGWCESMNIPYSGVPVGSIKKFITGKGNASKKEVIENVRARGFNPKDDNEADALALLMLVTDQAPESRQP
ncbi:MAG: hypothetical protein N0E48_16120 [Candidatus Thiodiazotropha endolucinida]|nr:hypothetical protein [Candidatus Thiodiazotropha taylori]MCW4344858.1 hypothetical protein [Candidatus Thiodiazotropha endolucinida]